MLFWLAGEAASGGPSGRRCQARLTSRLLRLRLPQKAGLRPRRPAAFERVQARHYAPDLGRFLSRDPLGFHDHSYAGDNPLSFRDPSGLAPEEKLGLADAPDYGLPPEGFQAFRSIFGDSNVEASSDFASIPAPVDSGNGMSLRTTPGMPTGAQELGEGTSVATAPATVQGTAETSGITSEPGVTPTAAGEAAEPTQSASAPTGPAGSATIEPAQPGEDLVRVRHYTGAGSAELIQRSGYLRAGSYVALQEEIPAGATQSEVTGLLELPAGHAEMYVDLEVPSSQLAIPPNGPETSGGLWQRVLISNFPIGNAQFQPVAL